MAPALLAALALLAGPPPAMREVDLPAIASGFLATAELYRTAQGIEVFADGRTVLVLPLPGTQELELDYQAAGPTLLTFGNHDGVTEINPTARPWRYRRLVNGRGTLRLDLRQAGGFTVSTRPYLVLQGTGRFTLARLRARPLPADREAVLEGFDRALLWAPNAIDHTTINLLETPMWSASRGIHLYAVLGVAFLALTAAVLLGLRALRGRWRPRLALAAGALAAVAAGDGVFLAKVLPALDLSVELDPEARIRENYAFDPQAGALAALARATLRPDERVGVACPSYNWYARELFCFNLAPRRCVFADPGQPVHAGLSGVDRLRPDELDAIVSFQSDEPLPPGFVRVAQVGPRAFVARRP